MKNMCELDKIQKILRIISKKHSFEIITQCQMNPSSVTEISKKLDIPYMTAMTRVNELVSIDILYRSITKKPRYDKKTKAYKTKDFHISITPKKISELTHKITS